MSLDVTSVNWLAVFVSAIATFMIGGLWYGALFTKKWVELHKFDEGELAEMASKQLRNFGLFFAGDVVMAIVLSLLVINLSIATAGGGAILGFVLWIGVAATIGGSKNAATNKPLGAYLIDTSHELAALVVMGTILGAWR